MGFDEVLNMFLPKKGLSMDEIKKYLRKPQTVDSRSHLKQGVRLSNIRENFSDNNKKFRTMHTKEEKVLTDLSDNYYKIVGDYARAYQDYLTTHADLSASVDECMKACGETHNTSVDNWANKSKACIAGCKLKGVQVLKCKNTYKGLQGDTSKKCKDLVKDHCDAGSIHPGKSRTFVKSADNADDYDTTLADGCCECGGGGGGKPTAYVNGTVTKNCSDVATAIGDSEMKSYCKSAGNGVSLERDGRTITFSASTNANFVNEYTKVKGTNDAAMAEVNKLKKKINTLTTTRDKLRGSIAGEEDTLDQNLKEFEEKYAKLQMYGDGGKDWTSIAQYTSTLNRRNSEELKFYMWSVLAIVLIITVISNFKKKAA